tara:strand:- start:1493 stop:2290 length:798 start_codon:yes stop_codon:yes gene_type:complete
MTQTANIINFERPVVKADIENGFTRIANELTDALMLNSVGLNGREFQLVHAIISKTYRYHKTMDWISSSQLAEMTGIDVSNISKVKKSLIRKKVVIEDGQKVGINTVVSDWVNAKNSQIRLKQKQSNPTSKTSNQTLQQSNPTNATVKSDPHNKKDNKTKDNINKKSKFFAEKIELPNFLPRTLWCEFVQHRKDIKKPLTELATSKLINQLASDHHKGLDIEEAINQSIASRWAGVFPKPQREQRNAPTPENFSRTNYGEIKGSF